MEKKSDIKNKVFDNNTKIIKKEDDKLSLALNLIKNDIHNFIYNTNKKGFVFKIKVNEKTKKIKIFVTLLNNSDINKRYEDIDFLIVTNEEYPQKAPKVFSLSCVKL
jgi:hypothetical protein